MAIASQVANDGALVTITIEGRFDFSSHRDFREAYESHGSDVSSYVIDMSDAVYLDSSALGMLLLLRDFAGGNDADIRVTNCSDDVKKIFSISNFEQLFSIS